MARTPWIAQMERLAPGRKCSTRRKALAPTASCSKDVSMLKTTPLPPRSVDHGRQTTEASRSRDVDTIQRATHLRRADSMIARGGSSMPLASTRITPAQPNVAIAAVLEGTLGDALESRQAKASERRSLTTTR